MNNKEMQLKAIPVDFVVELGLKDETKTSHAPYSTLIRTWAEHEGKAEIGDQVASQLEDGDLLSQLASGTKNIYSLMPTYRTGKKANMLIKIVREIDERIKVDSNWKWSYAMKVMLDAKIILTNIPNKFDTLICWMIPNKGKDNVRKSGDYKIVTNEDRPWTKFLDMPNVNFDEYMDREICSQIYEVIKPLLDPNLS
jgi:hypothetical protein